MKIAILTQPLKSNYGGVLQNYALQTVLKRLGHEVVTLDWGEKRSLRAILGWYYRWLKHKILPTKFVAPPRMKSLKERKFVSQRIFRFVDKYISRIQPPITTASAFRNIADAEQFDAYVVGSDQCWRPGYNQFLSSMYLDFVCDLNDIKRVAYAASFGTDKWEYKEKQERTCRDLVKKFDMVSVREKSGVKLCNEHFGVNASHVLDPTLLLIAQDYVSVVDAENEPQSKGTLFTYILDMDEGKASFVKRVEKETGYLAFKVQPEIVEEERTVEDIRKQPEKCIYPSVTSWLKAFMDAKMVIVDSFHGMVFSIIFNKPFWVLGNLSRGNERFKSLLSILELDDRLIDASRFDFSNVYRKIDWAKAQRIIDTEREKSLKMLMGALNNKQ